MNGGGLPGSFLRDSAAGHALEGADATVGLAPPGGLWARHLHLLSLRSVSKVRALKKSARVPSQTELSVREVGS